VAGSTDRRNTFCELLSRGLKEQGLSWPFIEPINMLIANRADIKRYGCPVGTLCAELAKLNHAAQPEAKALFTLFRTWLRRQFKLLGHKADPDVLAMHLLSRSQGIATLASSFHDDDFIQREVKQMRDWLDAHVNSDPVEGSRRSAKAPVGKG
jgi:hypothetical protein